MKEQCDRCGDMKDLDYFFERRGSYPTWRYKLCWECGEWLREKLLEKEGD